METYGNSVKSCDGGAAEWLFSENRLIGRYSPRRYNYERVTVNYLASVNKTREVG